VTPLDDVDSAAIDLAGRFCELVDRLDAALAELREQHTAVEWTALLERAVLFLAAPAPDAGWQEVQLRSELGDLRDNAEGSRALLGLADVRALLRPVLAGRPTRASFRTGTLTVCTLVPMRSVPHRVVCLLGMDDGAFPRQSTRDGDDVLARDPWVGERDPGAEDRQLLLDAVCAAGQHLVITCTGADSRTGAPVPPAVPLGELLDALDRTATVPAGRVRDAITTKHPLQPFDPRNFQPRTSVQLRPDRLRRGGRGSRSPLPRARPAARAAAPPRPRDVDLMDLLRLLEHPARGFLRQRLDVAVTRAQEDPQESLPVELDDLQRYSVAERLLQDRLRGWRSTSACAGAPARRGAARAARGRQPPDGGGPRRAGARRLRGRAGARAGVVRHRPGAADGGRLLGTVANVRGTVLLSTTCATLAARHRLRAWVQLVALSLAHPGRAGPPWPSARAARR
jgi:exodeoxyribonuclease V gamma subunit